MDASNDPRTASSVSRQNAYQNEPWYHGLLPREDINRLLREEGHFLVRKSEPKADQGMKLVLSVYWKGKPHHFVINERGGKSYVEKYEFDSVADMIKWYCETDTAVSVKSGAKLRAPVPRQDWELRHDQISLGKVLGEGAFGAVHVGTLSTGHEEIQVAVKVHKGKALTKDMIKEICKEARIMRRFVHPNLVRFYGAALEKEPIMLVMELVNGGSLDSYLRKNGANINTKQRVVMCFDAAAGLDYLHTHGCIHRDVAARNCLVLDEHVKISDFGLSREMSNHEKNYKLENLKQKLPIRWLAPETLNSATYSAKSDVFSYGVMMWEIFSDGAEPYPGMTLGEVNVQVRSGYRMAPPETMPRPLAEIMNKRCFPENPDDRWTMEQIRAALQDVVEGGSSKRTRKPRKSESEKNASH